MSDIVDISDNCAVMFTFSLVNVALFFSRASRFFCSSKPWELFVQMPSLAQPSSRLLTFSTAPSSPHCLGIDLCLDTVFLHLPQPPQQDLHGNPSLSLSGLLHRWSATPLSSPSIPSRFKLPLTSGSTFSVFVMYSPVSHPIRCSSASAADDN